MNMETYKPEQTDIRKNYSDFRIRKSLFKAVEMKLMVELCLEVGKTKAESILGRRRKREKGERQMDTKGDSVEADRVHMVRSFVMGFDFIL